MKTYFTSMNPTTFRAGRRCNFVHNVLLMACYITVVLRN